ncbi:MAG: hypothetical protein M3161_04005 [Actinomycetota bacterium]|nr:hypothetical protein [Actinomycetota bacterium]
MHLRRSEASSSERLPLADDRAWAQLLGRKISIRYRLHDDKHSHSEAIGVVAQVGGGRIGLLNRHGDRVDVAIGDIEAGKVFPTAP